MLELSADRTNINHTTTLALLFSMMTKIEERRVPVVRRRVGGAGGVWHVGVRCSVWEWEGYI